MNVATIQIGQPGLYPWDATLPVASLGEIQTVLAGPNKGRQFRYVTVARHDGSATIGFTVREGV